jgi:RND superfamily putative drug exporter
MALAVLVDATVIRGVLVPAAMRLAGRVNWWAPAALRRVQARIGLVEEPPPDARADLVGSPR